LCLRFKVKSIKQEILCTVGYNSPFCPKQNLAEKVSIGSSNEHSY
jgi:hypothetical protein